jgi:hypothetical protein
MRRLLSGLSVVVFVLALAAALPASWVASHVSDEDGFVAFAGPLAEDAEVQDAVAAYVAEELVVRAGVPEVVQPTVTRALARAARSTTTASGFREAWDETQRRSHRASLGDGEGVGAEGPVVVNLAPLAAFLAGRVEAIASVRLDTPDTLPVTLTAEPQVEAVEAVRAAPDLTRFAAVVAVVSALLALLVSRRRSGTLAALGASAVAVAGALWLAAELAVPRLVERTGSTSELAGSLQQVLAARAVDSFEGRLVVVAITGAAVVVVGLVGRAVAGRRA